MVRSHSNHAMPESNGPRDRTVNRPRRNRSPDTAYHKKSLRHHSSWHPSSEGRGIDNTSSRRHGRIDSRGSGTRGDRNRGGGDFRGTASNNRKQNKRPKWRRNKPKKRLQGRWGAPPLSGGNIAPVAGINRQPIASRRMRMDDYATPRTGRLLPLAKSNDIEHAVSRARREASTRTKDTFWTKKLLDAESSHPSRWAHSGFKELYREELGYSEMEKERSLRRSPGRSATGRENLASKGMSKRGRPASPSRQRSSADRSRIAAASKSKNESRIRTKSPRRKFSKSRSRSRSVNSRRRIKRLNSKGQTLHSSREKTSQERPGKRGYSRSLSRSLSSVSSRFDSHSDSRSYSSYSSSRSSSSTSSSFTSSSSGSLHSYRRRKRSYSRSSRSWSKSRSRSKSSSIVRPPPPKIKTASLSKAVQSVHLNKEKNKRTLTKTVTNTSEPKTLYSSAVTSTVVKTKAKTLRPPPAISIVHRHSAAVLPTPAPVPPPVAGFYEKEIAIEKSSNSPYIEPADKIHFKNDSRRGVEGSSGFKTAHAPNIDTRQQDAHVHASDMALARSEGEQSNSESSSDDDDMPMKLTLSERFGKLAQLSSQRQEYEGVRMKIVREGGQDKKVYLEVGTRSPSPVGRRSNVAHERWLQEHKAEYDEYEERYGEFRQWDPHRDLPRELPPNWDDVNVRFRYYKESGYFGERLITMEDYLKWEEWWYRYRDWLEKYGGVQEENLKYRGPHYGSYADVSRAPVRDRWIRRESHREKDDRKRLRY